MTVLPTPVKMAERVQMDSTALPARVFWVTLGTAVRQVRSERENNLLFNLS